MLWLGLYGFFAVMAFLNWALMRRPGRSESDERIAILIPARNEADNLRELLPLLAAEHIEVFVFDDESEDETFSVAESAGATVVRPEGPLLPGWTGKNRACHELAKGSIESSSAEWILFMDADVRPLEGFFPAMRNLIQTSGVRCPVITGFPKVRPGQGIEPIFLAWVGWVLLATNPFWIVSRLGVGHNRFMNGQFSLWRKSVYAEVWPNERVKGQILEDVMTGRLLARERISVDVVNVSSVLEVRMYTTWRQTLDGMSKNSFEITGSSLGTVGLAVLFLLVGFGWAVAGEDTGKCLIALIASGVFVSATARAPIWPAVFMPINLAIGAFTLLRSLYWRRTGRVRWKGRVYPS